MATAVTDEAGQGQSDAHLVLLHRAGDPKAFEALYNAYYHRLVRFVRQKVRTSEAAEDIAQESFARAYAAIEGLRDTSRFSPWLTMIAKRLIIDHYRLRNRISPVADLDLGPSDASDAPEGLLLAQQDHADVSEAMARIKGRHREVLILREHERMSYEQIAAHLGVPLTTVPPLLHRARLALRREYLLITEGEGTAGFLPVFFLVADALRRMRDRIIQVAAYMPDVSTLAGSVMAAAVTIAAMTPSMALDRVPAPAPAGLSQAADLGPSADAAGPANPRAGTPAPPMDAFAVPGSEGQNIGGVARVTIGNEAARRGRERDRREPIYVEHGGESFSVNPDEMRRDLTSSLRGDHGWMETEEGDSNG